MKRVKESKYSQSKALAVSRSIRRIPSKAKAAASFTYKKAKHPIQSWEEADQALAGKPVLKAALGTLGAIGSLGMVRIVAPNLTTRVLSKVSNHISKIREGKALRRIKKRNPGKHIYGHRELETLDDRIKSNLTSFKGLDEDLFRAS